MDSRAWTSFAVGAVCGAAPVLAWRHLTPAPRPGVAHATASGARVESGAREVPAAVAPDLGSRVPVTQDEVAILGQRLRAEPSPGGQFATLRELAVLGTPDALDLLFGRLFEDPDAFGAEMIWSLLHDVDDPRVYQLARMQFDRALAEGRSGPRYTSGYLRLIAAHGGVEGAELILSQILVEGRVRAREAAQVIGHLKDHSHASAYLDALTAPGMKNQRSIGKGLADWNDPFVTGELFAISRSPNVAETLRHGILHSLGYSARSTMDVDAVVSQYWATGDDPAGVSIAVGGLGGLQENPWIDRDVVTQRTTDVLDHLLTTENWRYGLSFISSYSDWKTPETKLALEALLATLEEPGDRARVSAELLSFP